MPSNRKRIGYLPSKEVHEIIENICSENNFSQSKVTGLLVEEALIYRGVLKGYLNKYDYNSNISKYSDKKDDLNLNTDLNNEFSSSKVNKNTKPEVINMINEFIEYKFFKKVMIQNKNMFE
tara:strand:- start:42 stop:404 length:363 start_codon:yes stop_codon:yes gene_type:complete